MKKLLKRTLAAGTAAAFVLALAGCSSASSAAAESTAESSAESAVESTDESSSSESAGDASTDEQAAEDAYAYLAGYSYSDGIDDNGYLSGLTAGDYVTLPEGYDSLTLPAGTDTVDDEAVSSYIEENILSNYTTTEAVTDRAAENGDSVNIDFVGSVDGVEFEGGSSGGSGYDLTLGSGSFIDDFEDQIVGHMPGETFDVEVTFPEDYQSTELAGKDAVFVTTLNHINEEVTPELSDEWVGANLAETYGFANVDELNTYVKGDILFSQGAEEVYNQVLEGATFADELPQTLTDYAADRALYSVYTYSSQYGMTVEQFLTAAGYNTVEDYLAVCADDMESLEKQILIIQAIAEEKGLICDDATLEKEFSTYFGNLDMETLTSRYGENYLRMSVLHDLTLQTLIDSATVADA